LNEPLIERLQWFGNIRMSKRDGNTANTTPLSLAKTPVKARPSQLYTTTSKTSEDVFNQHREEFIDMSRR
jgi:hypothetical protein